MKVKTSEGIKELIREQGILRTTVEGGLSLLIIFMLVKVIIEAL